jgi:sulfite oxidase
VDPRVHKHPDLVVRQALPYNGGPPPQRLAAAFFTPNDLFFVRNHAPVPEVDPTAFRLTVDGLVERGLELSLADLASRFERAEVVATLQCAGQRRQELLAVAPLPGELPWGSEAVGTARWSGYRLADVLAAAGVAAPAAHVGFEGLDTVERRGARFGFGGSVPLAKATAPEVLLADRMNGEPLPATHGAPLRVVVPGYIGARSVKWVRRVEVRERSSENYFQAVAYRLYPTAMTAQTADPAAGFELGEMNVTSLITQPRAEAQVAAGTSTVHGIAFSGGGRPVMRVEVSGDGGATWQVARLSAGEEAGAPFDARWSWRLFRAEVEVPAGRGEILSRAWDSAGNTQPEQAAALWNFKGYMNNAWSRVPVTAV